MDSVSPPQPAPSHRPRPRRILQLAGVFVGLVVGLAIAEVGLRLSGYQLPAAHGKRRLVNLTNGIDYHCYPSNHSGELQPLPDYRRGEWRLEDGTLDANELPLEAVEQTPYCVEYRMSPQRLRDRVYDREVPDGVVRVLGIGDSFAMGVGVPNEKSLFRQLERLAGAGVEFVNAGRSGSYVQHEYAQVVEMSRTIDFQRVLVIFVPNDVPPSDELAERESEINDLINVRATLLRRRVQGDFFGRHSRVVQLVRWQWNTSQIHNRTIDWYRDLYDPQINPKGLRILEQVYRHVATLPNVQAAVVLYPLMEGFDQQYPLRGVHARVAATCREVGLPVLDLAPAFHGHDPAELWVHSCDHHPNGTAHAIAADAIYTWLQAELPPFLQPDEE